MPGSRGTAASNRLSYARNPLLGSPSQRESALGTALLDSPPAGTTALSTFFNLINNYVGMVLLSMHFTFARSGWLALPVLFGLTAFGAFTGDCIILCYQTLEARNPTRPPSYAEIATQALGGCGKWLTIVSSLIEVFVANICMLIIIWQNVALLLPSVSYSWVIIGCVAASFPTNWLRDFSLLSMLSSFALLSIMLILAVVVYDVAADEHATDRTLVEPSGLFMSSSIMLAGLTGHVGLPPMYSEMKDPSLFRPTMYAAFLVMFLMYAVAGVGGYLLYGAEGHVLITEDMAAAGTSIFSKVLTTLVLGSITFKLFCGVPMGVLILVEIVQDLYQERTGTTFSEAVAFPMRVATWAGTIVVAIGILPYLEYVTALIGINSLLISVLLPLIFFLVLHRKTLGGVTFGGLSVLLVLTFIATVIISIADVQDFLAKFAGTR